MFLQRCSYCQEVTVEVLHFVFHQVLFTSSVITKLDDDDEVGIHSVEFIHSFSWSTFKETEEEEQEKETKCTFHHKENKKFGRLAW